MANLMDLLEGQLSGGVMDMLTQQIGAGNRDQTATATKGIVSTLMTQLMKNAASKAGAAALSGALDRDHDGSILDDVMGMVTGASSPSNTKATNGAGILKHVFGEKQGNVMDMIGQMSGLDKSSTGSLMETLAPMVMGTLGKQKREQNLDMDGIRDLLGNTVKSAQQDRAEMSMIEKFLDQDGDGSVMDDLMNMGGKLLGGFFKNK
jgi:hypothetical protein